MGAGASKAAGAGAGAARRLPTKAATGTATSGAAEQAMRAAQAAAAELAASDAAAVSARQEAREFEYGRDGRKKQAPSFSGEKDDEILKDGMDPQFMANLSRLGQVAVPEPAIAVPARAQRTLRARDPVYTTRTLTPPPGTVSAQTLSSLLDAFKSVPEGRDAGSLYNRVGLNKDQIAGVRRWVNSPSVASETTSREELGNGRVNHVLQMKAVWIDATDKDAPKKEQAQ